MEVLSSREIKPSPIKPEASETPLPILNIFSTRGLPKKPKAPKAPKSKAQHKPNNQATPKPKSKSKKKTKAHRRAERLLLLQAQKPNIEANNNNLTQYKLTFGPYQNFPLDAIPPHYLTYISTRPRSKNKPDLQAILDFLQTQKQPTSELSNGFEPLHHFTPQAASEFIFTSPGPHQGFKLSSIPPQNLRWILDNTPRSPSLVGAIHALGIHGYGLKWLDPPLTFPITWHPPPLNTILPIFFTLNKLNKSDITEDDASEYFQIEVGVLKRCLEGVQGRDRPKGRFWLYQVFYFRGRIGGEGELGARKGLYRFLGEKGGMGGDGE